MEFNENNYTKFWIDNEKEKCDDFVTNGFTLN